MIENERQPWRVRVWRRSVEEREIVIMASSREDVEQWCEANGDLIANPEAHGGDACKDWQPLSSDFFDVSSAEEAWELEPHQCDFEREEEEDPEAAKEAAK